MRKDQISWKSLRVDGHRGSVNVFVLDPLLSLRAVSFGRYKEYMKERVRD